MILYALAPVTLPSMSNDTPDTYIRFPLPVTLQVYLRKGKQQGYIQPQHKDAALMVAARRPSTAHYCAVHGATINRARIT